MYVLGHLYKQVQDWNVNGDNLNRNNVGDHAIRYVGNGNGINVGDKAGGGMILIVMVLSENIVIVIMAHFRAKNKEVRKWHLWLSF